MVLQTIYVQYYYDGSDYFLPGAEIHVLDYATGGSIYNETCYSEFLELSTGCEFELEAGIEYVVRARKTGYHEDLVRFTAPDDPYLLLVLTPREPSVETRDAGLITTTSARIVGRVIGLDGLAAVSVNLLYAKVGESYITLPEEVVYEPDYIVYKDLTGLTPDTTYNYKVRAENETDEDTFYVFGETKQFTTLLVPVYDMAIDFVFPATTLLKDANIFDGEDITFNSLIITNNGNVDAYAWYTIAGAGVDIQVIDAGLLSPTEAVVIPIPDQPTTAGVGDHTINLNVGASTSTSWDDVFPTSDNRTEQLTISAGGTPPSGVSMSGERYRNVCGAEIANNCITFDIHVDHFGSDSECTVYSEYWSEGDTEHNFTDPIIVPYDPEYEEGGFGILDITICIPNCEGNHYIRAIASNSIGTNYSETLTPITVRLDAPTEITQTSVMLNAYIVSMGSISTGVANFYYGTPSPAIYDLPHLPISSTGAISRTITGLVPNTTYQYYLFARHQLGYPQTISTTLSFTTLPEPEPPVVWTATTFWITQTSAQLRGHLASCDGVSTHVGFEYGKTTSYGTTVWVEYRTDTGLFLKDIDGLEPDTTYYVRAIATNEHGTGYGNNTSFTTLPETFDITFVATAPGISDLHNVDVVDITNPEDHKYLGET